MQRQTHPKVHVLVQLSVRDKNTWEEQTDAVTTHSAIPICLGQDHPEGTDKHTRTCMGSTIVVRLIAAQVS